MKLTKPQQLIYDSEKVIGGPFAVMCGIMTVDKVYPEEQIVEAIKKIYETNDALNYKLDDSGFEPQMYYESPAEREINVIRVNTLYELDEIGKKAASTPFDMKGWLSDLTAVIRPDGYGFIIKVHHLLGDAWSMSLIATQLNEILEGTPYVRYSYEDYINAEEEYLNSKKYARDRQFFLSAFEECPEPVMLSDKVSADYRVKKLFKSVDEELLASLRSYAEETETSEFDILFCAFAVLYGKLKNCSDRFFLGMPVLNRMSEKDLNTVGMYINTVPVPVCLDYEMSFAQNLQEINNTLFSVFKHQKYNYNDIQRTVSEEYGYQGRLYDCTVNYQPDEIFSDETMSSTDYSRLLQSENLQLVFHNRNREAGLEMEYEYRMAVFTEDEVERIHSMFMHMLNLLLTDDKLPLKDVSLIGEDEHNLLINDFNSTAVPYDKNKNVYDLFLEQADKCPELTAVTAIDRALTYAELKAEAARLANGLKEQGIGKGDIVAFCLPRDSRLITTMLGILQTGAAYLPLDTQLPKERLEYILNDSKAKLCITDKCYDEMLSATPLSDKPEISADSICYCIYTSGSTGMPKGTLLTHANVVNYISCAENSINAVLGNECKKVLSVTSVGFDIFVTESLLPLANGRNIILANERQSQFGAELQALLNAHQPDAIQTTPSKMRLFLQNMPDMTCLQTLKCIILGGETLDRSLVERLKTLTDAKIYNVYGPTEATVWATCAKVSDADEITIGKPLANTQIYILDRYLKPAPLGETGELCIAGDCVSPGYLNRDDLTTERFIDNPFGDKKLYKTGDLAYWRADGNIAFVGRNDYQVKINGQRVELGEIESALSSQSGIESSAVVVNTDENGGQIICAYYTGKEISSNELRAELSRSLPRYMLPQIFVHLESMPLNTSGKTDRSALPAPDFKNADSSAEYVAAQTDAEKALISTAMQLLKCERIGMLDNFFDLGGDSLKSIAWITLLEQHGYTLSPTDIFSSADMNELKEKMKPTESRKHEEPEYPDRLPLTSVQTEIYTAQSIAPDKPVYNIPYAVKVESLDINKLQHAVDSMLKRHEILRTRFENADGELSQIIEEKAACNVERIDGEIADFIRPFDLSKAPLLRVGYKDNIVIFDLHHLIADGSSMPIFFRELNEYYMGREPIESAVPYKYFAVTENNKNKDNDYWLGQFSDDVPSINLNTDYPRPAMPTYDGESLYFHMSKSEYEKIEAFCKAENITPFVYYYGAFQILMQKFSGQEDIVIGAPMSGRTAENIGTIGIFVRTLPLRCKPEGSKTAGQFFREVREQSVAASQHSEFVPSDVAKSKGRTSLFDVMFTYQAEEMTNLLFADKPAELTEITLPASKCDLSFDVYPRGDSIVLSVTYNTSLFRRETMQRIESAYEKILNEALSADIEISDISVMDGAEKDLILNSFNNTAIPYDNDKSVYDLFINQVNAQNNAVIRDENSTHSFAELENDAARIDAFIRKTAGSSKQVIGVLCDRSYDELAVIYGIIRGGNAYMPISPQYPAERIKTMLESSGCNTVIAQRKYCSLADNSYAVEDILSDTNECDIPEPAAKPGDTLYVIYTSGSTGIPKGVMVTNRSAVNRIEWMKNKFFDSSTVVMLKTPYTFDVSVWEIFGFGMYGFSLCILPEDEHYNQSKVLSHIEKGQVTDLHFVPTVFEQFLTVLRGNPVARNQLKSLRHVILSGESLSAKAVNEFNSFHDGQITVHNLYGPAECAVDVTSYDCAAIETDPIPIGKPIANTQIYITDKYMKPVPLGVIGELCIGGENVGQGYINRADLTAERFIDNPFGDGKLYKTGDLAYWRKDGNIVFVGRNDFQIKINGQRVELGEIESAILSEDGVDSAAVIVNTDENGVQVICAYYTGNEISSNELRERLGHSLPRYMLPQIFVHLDNMPLNSSGKIDRNALLQIPVEAEGFEQSYEAPKTQREEEICSLFCEVLSADRIGRSDNFYDFGGTSLQLVRLLSRPPLNALSASDFLADPTPAGLAKRLDEVSAANKYIVPLYTAESSDKAFILFPYAGGDASAYTALISAARENNIDISLYFVDWADKDGLSEIAEEIRVLAAEKRVCFYSHCAGSALAMALLDILNKESKTVRGYIAAANIPPSKALAGFNIWKYMSDNRIIKTLMRAGLELDNGDEGLLNRIVKRFRRQTKLYNSYFSGKQDKTNTSVTVIVSKKDPFTYNYTKAEALWKRVVTDVNKVIVIDTPSHYFLKTNTDLLLDEFSKIQF